ERSPVQPVQPVQTATATDLCGDGARCPQSSNTVQGRIAPGCKVQPPRASSACADVIPKSDKTTSTLPSGPKNAQRARHKAQRKLGKKFHQRPGPPPTKGGASAAIRHCQ